MGVPASLHLSFIKQESSFERTARPPRKKVLGFIPGLRPSSAYGYSQARWNMEEYKVSTKNLMPIEKILEMLVILLVGMLMEVNVC